MTPGKKTYNAMKTAGKDIAAFPIINILSLVPFAIGGAVYIVNAATAPVISVFMKGSSLKIPAARSWK